MRKSLALGIAIGAALSLVLPAYLLLGGMGAAWVCWKWLRARKGQKNGKTEDG